jgi:hypothetical protein
MDGEAIATVIQGARDLIDWFGRWPSFHDAEIIDLHLARGAPSRLRLATWLMSGEVDANGRYCLEREAIVTFVFTGISDLELANFSNQNVISGLSVEPRPGGIRLALGPCYGLAGFIEAESVRVELVPGLEDRQRGE